MKWIVAAVVLAVTSAPAAAQGTTEQEIELARALARYRWFDLAIEHLEEVEREAPTQEQRLKCLLARADVEKLGGDHAASIPERLALLHEAIDHYADFVARVGPSHRDAPLARCEIAACQRRIGVLLGGLAAQGVEREKNRADADVAFRDAVDRLDLLAKDLRAAMEKLGEDSGSALAEARLRASEAGFELTAAWYEWAQVVPPSDPRRRERLEKSLEHAHEYLWDFGAETFQSFEVGWYAGVASLGLGAIDEGVAQLEAIVDDSAAGAGAPRAIASDPGLPPEHVAAVTAIVEKAYLALARFRNEQGRPDLTVKLGPRLEKFHATFASRGARRSESGERFLLELAQARLASGDPGGTAAIEEVVRRHPSDAIGDEARALLTELVRRRAADGPGVQLAPATWIAMGDAARRREELEAAIDAYRRGLDQLGTIADEGERARVALDGFTGLGQCQRALGRHDEAAKAFERGLDAVSGRGGLDDERVQQLGIAWFNALALRFKATRDPADRQAKDDALRRLATELEVPHTGWLLAKDEFEQARAIPATRADEREAAFADAARKLEAIGPDDPNHERAQLLLARCDGEQGGSDSDRFERALRTLDAFTERARRAEPPEDPSRGTARAEALAEAACYRAEYLQALDRHEAALAALRTFEQEFPRQKELLPEVSYRRLTSLLALGRLADAEALHADVTRRIAAGEMAPWRASAGFWLAKALLAAGEREADPAKKDALLARGAARMAEYSQATQHASYNNLLSVGQTWARIGEWAEAEAALEKLVEVHGGDPKHRDDLAQRVQRTLAEAKLRQRKFKDAEPLYRDLETRFPKDPDVLRGAALCYGGWLDVTDGKVIEVPGAGDYERAIVLWDKLVEQGFRREERLEAPGWYEAKLQAIYARWRAKEADPGFLVQARAILTNFDETVLPFVEDQPGFLDRLGGETGRRKWDYLRAKLR